MSSTPAPTGAAAGVSQESHVPEVGTTIPVPPTGEDVDVHDNFQDNYHLDDGVMEAAGWLNMNELRDAYRYMSLDVSSAAPRCATAEERATLSVCCNLGHPVDVADSHAILRIALGSESLAQYLNDPEGTTKEDQLVVMKLGLVAKYLQSLQNSSL